MKIFLSLLISICFLNCSQSKNEIHQNQNITAANIVQEISKQVKHYPSEPMYAFRQYCFKCYFEIYIDDILVAKNFDNLLADAFEINNVLFKSGIHKVSYKLYPLGNNNVFNTNYPTLVDDTDFTLSLVSYDQKDESADDIEHFKYNLPKIENKITKDYSTYKFEGSGKKYYENSFEIKVDIPYALKFPFENSTDLRKLNKEELQKKVLKEYQNIREIYLKKDADGIAKLTYDRLKDDLVADYATDAKVKAAWEQLNEIIIKGDVDILPLEKYTMQFFANGKLVALITDGSDPEIRGGNALVCKIKSGEFKGSIFEIKHFLYLPEGATEFKVY